MTRQFSAAFLYANATSFAAAVGAAFVAMAGHNGWGWLIVLAVITHTETIRVEAPSS